MGWLLLKIMLRELKRWEDLETGSNKVNYKNNIKRRSDFIDRIGTVRTYRFGSKMKIIEHLERKIVLVEFENGFRTTTKFYHFKNGTVHNPYDKSVYSVGYMGEGPFKFYINYKHTIEYRKWHGIFQRCYDPKLKNKYTTYENCKVCEEWYNFQNFGYWFKENFYQIPGEKMEIDKDILIKNNKLYGPETALIVPSYINILFTKNNKFRGDYPIGVYKDITSNKFKASCNSNKKRKHLGYYNTPEEAFLAYKNFKEKTIKETAEEYKNKIPNRLYKALISYKVEITD